MPTLKEEAAALADSAAVKKLLEVAIAEDIGPGDVTTAIMVSSLVPGLARIIAREAGIICGLPIAQMAARMIESRLRFDVRVEEGAAVEKGTLIATVTGPAGRMLSAERLILNILQRMSGIATTTRRYVDAAKGGDAVILETRKTVPGWRLLDKYAVRAGGGENHRLGLYDQILAKENHFAMAKRSGLAASFADGVSRLLRERPAGMKVEVEVETLDEFRAALERGADIIMLDDMSIEDIRTAVMERDAHAARIGKIGPELEISGGVTLQTVHDYAMTGVERISVGALTHSVKAMDIAMKIALDESPLPEAHAPVGPDGDHFIWPHRFTNAVLDAHETVGSTNDLAFARLEDARIDSVVVTAEEQTEGRGRRGTKWWAPKGASLLFSLGFTPKVATKDLALLSPAAAIAVAEALAAELDGDVKIKWPNDVFVDHKKIAGVLLETRQINGAARVVVGIGLNVRQPTAWFRGHGLVHATSVVAECERALSRTRLMASILASFGDLTASLEAGDVARIQRRFDEFSYLTGRWVTLECGGRVKSGSVKRIDLEHGLILESDGEKETFAAAHSHILSID